MGRYRLTDHYPGRMPLLPRRRPRLPAEAATALQIGDEQVLAWSPLAVAGYVAVTRAGLRALTAFSGLVRRPWVEIDHMTWDAESRTLAVWWVGLHQPTGLELPEGSFVPEAAHERWRSSVLTTRELTLPDGRRAWVALRRDGDGRILTQVNLSPGAGADDPLLAAAVQRMVATLREEAGVDGIGPDLPGRIEW